MLPTVAEMKLYPQYPAVPSEHFLLPGGSAHTLLVYRSLGVAAWHMADGQKELEFSICCPLGANSKGQALLFFFNIYTLFVNYKYVHSAKSTTMLSLLYLSISVKGTTTD